MLAIGDPLMSLRALRTLHLDNGDVYDAALDGISAACHNVSQHTAGRNGISRGNREDYLLRRRRSNSPTTLAVRFLQRSMAVMTSGKGVLKIS